MNVYRRWFFNTFAGIAIILAVVVWAVFAPVRLGGRSEYIIINGISMEPGIHQGDLVIVQPQPNYTIGDAVAYWNAQLSRYVFHRIIGMNLDHYIFQGDNNSWIDSYTPVKSELIGKQWIRIPGFGKLVEWIRKPINFALVVGGLGGLIMGFLFIRSKQDHSKKKSSSSDFLTTVKEKFIRSGFTGKQKQELAHVPVSSGQGTPPASHNWNARELNNSIEIAFFLLGLLAIAALVLAAFAFFNPLTRTDALSYPYEQQGAFTYSATAPAGVYDTQAVQSGDPIYTKLTCAVNLNFQYLITADGLQQVSGTHQLTAILTEPTSGWTRSFPLEAQQTFADNQFSSQAKVDFCQMQSVLDAMEKQTGVTSYTYSLLIDPKVQVTGVIHAAALQDSFNAPLTFQLDKTHAFVSKVDPKVNPLMPSLQGMASAMIVTPNSLSIFGLDLPVRTARLVSLVGLAISLLGLLALSLFISLTSQQSKEMLVRMKYGSSLVEVEPQSLALAQPAVDVRDIDDLARLAERSNTVILHRAQGWQHTYLVEGDKITYRYVMNEGSPMQSTVAGMQSQQFDFRQAIERGEFKIYYQPIVSLPDGKIKAVEALLRWQHPQNGLISAKDFITAAETSGLIDSIGEWVLQEACTQINQWRKAGYPLRLAVNFSLRQLEKFPVKTISQVLQRTGMSADALQIEIPETSIAHQSEIILANLAGLKQLGVHLSLDGYSGSAPVASVQDLPIDSIKIDRTVIEKLNEPKDAEYLQGLISAALDRGLNVVAEGVETQDQMEFLRSQLCSQAQGFLIARPAPAEEISSLLVNA